MSILNVNTIQPIGSGTTVTVAATELKTSNFITVGTGASVTSPSANVLTLGTNTAERLRITSAGSIGIGTDNPGTKLDVRGGNWSNGDIVVGQTGNAGRVKFRRGADGSDSGSIGFAAADNNSVLSMNVGSGDGTLTFQTNSTERLRIDSSGRLLIGRTSTSHEHPLQVQAASGANAIAIQGRSVDDQSEITFYENDNSTILGQIQHLRTHSTYRSRVGYLRFDSGGYNEKMRLDSSGRLGLGVVPEAFHSNNKAVIRGDSGYTILGRGDNSFNISQNFYYDSSDAGKYIANGEASLYNQSDGQHVFYSAVSGSANASASMVERLRIDVSGRVTKPTQPLAVIGTTQNNPTPSAGSIVQFDYAATNRGNHYNTSNYTFTCPVAGDYMVILRHSRKGWVGDLDFEKNGTTHAYLELRETGLNGAGTPVPDWQAGSYSFIVPCAANDVLRWKVGATYTSPGSGGYLLDGYNHIKYDAVTYYLIG
jgi:hypothetical protein